MKFNNKQLWTIYTSLIAYSGWLRAMSRDKDAKRYEKLALKIEKELK